MPIDLSWPLTARRRLLALRRNDGAWGYRPQSSSSVEASALASLALLATAGADRDPLGVENRTAAADAARWIADQCRRADGSTAVSARSSPDAPGWTTPFALLLWNALGGFADARRGAVAWLLAMKGKPNQPVPNNPMGHDVTLIGWPWVADTHSWVEPTAAALLALAPGVPLDQPRLREGVRVLLDRAISTGGWNLGNPLVFGQTIRPLPGPTGLALLALARVARASSPPTTIHRALAYLRTVVDQTGAPTSLGWAALGLRAWDDQGQARTAARLTFAAERALSRPTTGAVELAMLLLGSSDQALATLGITTSLEPELAR